ncbi:ornithine cyclodeaminase family protein [Aliikangiella sp. G2MR2-5]|uniref:ornithine cyclodeaminase family protein n=1 Tax=Aliikangiella sp. G2MR2-5 TaxID=2788943 RepID=UPI0018AAD0C6|nr:ornithine cyclodeaminase family protein [Aliikangiella sp. G2MR2-5]
MLTFIDQNTIEKVCQFDTLIPALKRAFASATINVPMRHHHDFPNPVEGEESTLLLMPAWDPGKDLGVKMVTVSPNNGRYNLPSIQGIYLLFDAHKGGCRALLDAKSLTALRTAATSALASSLLSRPDSRTLLMIGTGALSSKLIKAHATVRPINRVLIWGRDKQKALNLRQQLSTEDLEIEVVDTIEQGVARADILSCATLSKLPLIKGKWLRQGQHLDMVGAYRPDMREADDDCLKRSEIFVDHYAGATKETGDIVIPMSEGVIDKTDLKAELFELCAGTKTGRGSAAEITFFKSVGHALEDLVAATLVADKVL